uniref:Uncharacterized protein n=1 Tax=viral metagenome TaxID=1070528 RepID=A0A6C0JNE3_9ZZZZ
MSCNTDEEIIIHKGKSFSNYYANKKTPIVIAFDLDETLGSFSDLDILWRTLISFQKNKAINFNKLLDLYPEFLRYGILYILEFIYNKKKKGICDKLYIYTNNQCSPEWSEIISKYFDYKLNTTSKLFDKIICAFKINNQIIELNRTSNRKKHNDFINCTLLPKKTKICFIDNTYFYEMNHDRVYYIQPLSYVHSLSKNVIVERFMNSILCDDIIDNNKKYILADLLFIQFSKTHNDIKNDVTDIYVSQKIMYHVKEFFHLIQKKNYTKKIKICIGRFTRKKKS